MNNFLKRIQIIGLHEGKTVDIKLRDNTMILVGENGSGKTTILRLTFYFLSGRWKELIPFRFEKIMATIGDTNYEVTHEELLNSFGGQMHEYINNLKNDFNPIIITDETERRLKLRETLRYLKEVQTIINAGQSDEFKTRIREVRNAIPTQILYLPTYRRIERELSSIFEGFNVKDFYLQQDLIHSRENDDGFIEYVEFGMKDVQDLIDDELARLKEFASKKLNSLTLRYLDDIINLEYEKVSMKEIAEVPHEKVKSVLDRIDENILSKASKEHLSNVISSARLNKSSNDDHRKIVSHYFLKLLKILDELHEKEKPISYFCESCSNYIVDKRFEYDSVNFSFSIIPIGGNPSIDSIKPSDLSSGEKQIVSLFSHLYLSGKDSFFLLIDEPELSLSVPWQRRFLTDIKNSGLCVGLIAATHSPFIYDNCLREYTHSLGEFVGV